MRVKIIAGGIYGAHGEVPVGTILDVQAEPIGWAGRYEILGDDDGKTAVTNPENTGGADETQTGGAGQEGAGTGEDGANTQQPPAGPIGPFEAKDKGEGWWAIYGANGEQIGKSIRRAEGEAFNGLSEADKMAFVAEVIKN